MKKFWKALGITALAAVIPVRMKKDEESGVRSYRSLLWKLDVSPDAREIDLDLTDGVLTAPLANAIMARREAELFTDDPVEAAVFPGDQAEDAAPEEPAAAEADFDPEA